MKRDAYYEARGFSVYYFANVMFHVVRNPTPFVRNLENIFGDERTAIFMEPFKKDTNLHEFIRAVTLDVLTEDVDSDTRFLGSFLHTYSVPFDPKVLEDLDAFDNFMIESDAFRDAVEALVEEIFHVLFNNVGFLQDFNRLCAGYIAATTCGEEFATKWGTLKRVKIPKWVRRSVFHRDQGECRSCKRSLATIINQLETERYDHIVPLAAFGANDITNLQLLCEGCNGDKSASDIAVSGLYQRAFPNKIP